MLCFEKPEDYDVTFFYFYITFSYRKNGIFLIVYDSFVLF